MISLFLNVSQPAPPLVQIILFHELISLATNIAIIGACYRIQPSKRIFGQSANFQRLMERAHIRASNSKWLQNLPFLSRDPTRSALTLAEFFAVDLAVKPVLAPARLYFAVELTSSSKKLFRIRFPWEDSPDDSSKGNDGAGP